MISLSRTLVLTILVFISYFFITINNSYSQSVYIGTNPDGQAHSSAILEIDSDSHGVLLPRMTEEERDEIPINENTPESLLIFNTTSECFEAYVNEHWHKIMCASCPCGGVTIPELDGYTYSYVPIGNQCWLAENLRTTKLNDGTEINLVEDQGDWFAQENPTTPMRCWYDNDYDNYGSVYGSLYNFTAVATDKLCPDGWKVPSDEDFVQLELYLGMDEDEADILDGNRGHENIIALKLRSCKTEFRDEDPGPEPGNACHFDNNPRIYWLYQSGTNDSDKLGIDSYEFGLLPGGIRGHTIPTGQNAGRYYFENTRSALWTKDAHSETQAIYRSFVRGNTGDVSGKGIGSFLEKKYDGMYVRCISE